MSTRLADFDFSELLHYVEGLGAAVATEDRREWARALDRCAGTLPNPARAVQLGLCAYACAEGRGDFAAVQREFAELVTAGAGWSAAQVFECDRRAKAADDGRKGGRPSKAARNKRWAARYEHLKLTRRGVPARDLWQDIAAEDFVLWTTVRDGLTSHRKATGKR